MTVVLDTSALIYWTLDPDRLSARAAEAITTADRILISAISIWEIAIKAKRGRLTLPMTVRAFTEVLERTERVEIVPVDAALWIENVELEWDHRDPADRTVVALAARQGFPLATSDRQIRNFYEQAIW